MAELTYEDVLEHGEHLEDQGSRYSRYWIDGDVVWVDHGLEEIADPDDDSDPDFYERDDE